MILTMLEAVKLHESKQKTTLMPNEIIFVWCQLSCQGMCKIGKVASGYLRNMVAVKHLKGGEKPKHTNKRQGSINLQKIILKIHPNNDLDLSALEKFLRSAKYPPNSIDDFEVLQFCRQQNCCSRPHWSYMTRHPSIE